MSVNGNIRKFRFDLSLNDGQIFDTLGDKLIALTNTKLIKIVEAVVEQSGEKDLVIDKLEIDVGHIDLNNLDALARAFENELIRLLPEANQLYSHKNSKKEEEALLFFIEKGYYPWWINSKERFNAIVLRLDTTSSFSDQFLSTAFSDQQKYFRLLGSLGPEAMKIFIKKVVGQNQRFFNSLVRFFDGLSTSQIITPQENTLQLRAFEYAMIHQMSVLKQANHHALFYSAVKYISKRLNMPLTYFLSLLSQKLDLDKLDSNIKSLLIALLDQLELKGIKEGNEIYTLQRAVYKSQSVSILEERNRLLSSNYGKNQYFNAVIQYLEKGIFENIFDLIDIYKVKFEFLIHSKSEELIRYLSSVAFLKSNIKVERLATLSNSLSLEQIAEWLDTDAETRGIIEDLKKIFTNKEFKAALSYYEGVRFSPTFFQKAILVALLKTRKQFKAGSVFIDTFLQQYIKTGAVERNELLFELYRLGEKRTFKRVSNRLFDLLFSSPPRFAESLGKTEEIKEGEVDENLPEKIIPRIDEMPKMSAQDQLSFLLDLFSQLQDPTKNSGQFLFPLDILAYLDASTLERFFKQIKSQLDFSVLQLIAELIQVLAIKVDKKELLLIYQNSFVLLMTKRRPLNADQFKKELKERLIEKAPQFFQEETARFLTTTDFSSKGDIEQQLPQDKEKGKVLKKEFLNLIQELIEEEVLALDKQALLLIYENAIALLESKDKAPSGEDFKKELKERLIEKAPQFFQEETARFLTTTDFSSKGDIEQQLPQDKEKGKVLKKEFLNLIQELIEEEVLALDKQALLLIYENAIALLESKDKAPSGEDFKKELKERLIKKAPQFFKKEKKEPIKTASSKLKEDLASHAQIDKAFLATMKKEDLTQWIVDLFMELPASKKKLEQILFKRTLFAVLDVASMKGVFEQLSEKLQFDLIEKVEDIVKTASIEKKDLLRYEGFRSSFQILISKGTQITSDQFSKSLLDTLVRHYPQSFESGMKSIVEETKKGSALEKMIKEINKRLDGKVQKHHENLSIEKFDTLLLLKQDILINAEEYATETLDVLFESYADILVSKENLLVFLKTHFQDHELMLAFAEIGLQPEQTETLKQLFDQDTLVFDLEKRLLDLQSQFNVVVLPFESFKVILRTFIFKKIGAKGNMHEFFESEFVIDFFESLKRENFINLQQLSIYLDATPKNETDKVLAESLSIFNLRSKFSISNTKLKDALYFKDLVFSFLKTDAIPSWASIENFDLNDVVLFIKTIINKEDRPFLLSLISDPKINERLVAVIQALQEQEKMRFLELIQQSNANYNLATLAQQLIDYLSDFSLSDKVSNIDYFIGLILNQGLWKQSSLISFIEKVVPLIPKKASLNKIALLKHLEEKGFNISKTLFQITKKRALTNEELMEVLKFFLETNNFPKHLLHRRDELQSQIHTLLMSQDDRLWSIVNEYSYKPNLFERLFIFIDFHTLFHFIVKNRVGDFSFFTPVSAAIDELDDQKKFSKKEQSQLLVTLLIKFEKQVTEVRLKGFLIAMMQENRARFEDLLSEIKKRVKQQTPIDKNQKSFFDAIKISDKEAQSQTMQTIDPLNVLEYYLEIGSVNFENKPLSKKALFKALEQLIKEDLIVTKRVLYQWVRSDLKLSRLLDLIPPQKTSFILDLIHPELVKLLDLFSKSVLQFFGNPIEKVLSIKNYKDYQHKILKYWSSRNIFLDSPFEIIVLLFEELLKIENVSSKTYFEKQLNTEEELPLQMSHFLSSLKRNYAHFKNQLTEELILKEEEGGLEEQNETDSIVIQNAGLIILWPFFYRLFDKCGFLIDKEFKDDESLQKAILLTQYLVTGVTKCNENELVLNKILCGAPQNSHVDVTVELDELYTDLCDSLLKGVLKNWEKLSNSSVETLRETFLIREGILRPVELDYNLNVIKGPFDMLIETIPWNISIIQTTFMKNRITVDWK